MGPDKDIGSGDITGHKRGRQYAPDNTREDGSYRVGRGRPPEQSRFRQNDGRKRGRRPKGQRNFDTEFEDEARRLITVRENGKKRRVTKMRGAIIRAFDSATAKSDPRSASLVFSHAARIGDRQNPYAARLSPDDDEELNAWLRERLTIIQDSEPQPSHNFESDVSPQTSAAPEAGGEE